MPDYFRDWYYLEPGWRGDSLVRGPFTLEQMRAFLKGGTISEITQVRCGFESHWHPLQEISGLFVAPGARKDTKPGGPRRTMIWSIVALGFVSVALALLIAERYRGPSAPTGSIARPHGERLSADAIIGLTNDARASQGLAALSENRLLDSIAEARARDMIEKQYFAHVSPTGEQATDLAQRVGYPYKIMAENIASGSFFTNRALVDGWMQSPGHRRNILSSDVLEMGAAVVQGNLKGEETWVSVQIFGLQSPAVPEKTCAVPSPQLLRDIETKKAEIAALSERIARLKQDLDKEADSIELERRIAGSDGRRNYDLTARIKAYNETSDWHNRSLAEMKAKQTLLSSMVDEYNRDVQTYKNCEASDRDHTG
jgi:uncharacterized protein YkwD